MDDRRRNDRRKGSRRRSDRIKKMILLIFTAIAFVLLNLRITGILLSAPLPRMVIGMGLFLPVVVTLIIILMLIEKIKEVKAESSFDLKGLTILIAESNIVNIEILSAILEKTNIAFEFASSKEAVISMLEGNLCKYNLIFIDLQLPEMQGYEIARSIRSIDSEWAKKIPLIAMITNPGRAEMESCISAGINGHIEKIFDPDNVCMTIQKRALFFNKSQEDKKIVMHGIAWNEGLALGDENVDGQHHQIFGMVSGLVAACADGTDALKLKESLDFLVNYTLQHLSDEEDLMLRYNYPGFKNHKQMHDQFKITVSGLVQRFETNDNSKALSSDLIRTVVRWLTTHIMQEDKKIVSHIRSITIKKARALPG